MRLGTCFSGIGAPELASAGMGWSHVFAAEVEPFPSSVLAARFPGVPNLGDVAKVDWSAWRGKVDVMVGGPPCQEFSIAGQRAGIAGPRGSLSLRWVEVLDAVDPRWSVTENVPGWLSMRDNGFGAFLGALVGGGSAILPPGGKWKCSGVVIGPRRVAAWRVLDAKYFGVPQRRRRVFIVAGRVGDGTDPVAVLLERQGVRGDFTARGEAGEEAAGTPRTGSKRSGGDEPVIADYISAHEGKTWTHEGNNFRLRNCVFSFDPVQATHPENRSRFDSDLAHTLARDNAARATLAESSPSTGSLVRRLTRRATTEGRELAHAVTCHQAKGGDPTTDNYVTHTLRSEGFDASEDGTGRGTPLVADPISANEANTYSHAGNNAGRLYNLIPGGRNADAVEADAASLLRTLRQQVGAKAFAEWGSRILDSLQSPEVLQQALHGIGVRRAAREAGAWMDDGALSRAEGVPSGAVCALWENGPDGRSSQGRQLAKQLAVELGAPLPFLSHEGPPRSRVRRLTPREAERLQGFADGHTDVPFRGKPASDSARYRAVGNSMAVPVMRWILERIEKASK